MLLLSILIHAMMQQFTIAEGQFLLLLLSACVVGLRKVSPLSQNVWKGGKFS